MSVVVFRRKIRGKSEVSHTKTEFSDDTRRKKNSKKGSRLPAGFGGELPERRLPFPAALQEYGSIVHLMRYGFQIGYDDDEILTDLLCRRRAKMERRLSEV